MYRATDYVVTVADGRCFCFPGINDTELQEHYDEFFEEVFTELEDKVC